jgi:uridine phosphorylase
VHIIPESELVLNSDGSVYHLGLLPENIADTIITVGDPGRVFKVSKYFDTVDFEMTRREYITHTGTYNGKRITVMSTGMGTDNIEILMTELDALVNVDLSTRQVKENKKALNIIRIGTSGSIQLDVPLDGHLASVYGIGLDTLMCFYTLEQSAEESAIGQQIQDMLQLPFKPYCVAGSATLRNKFAFDMLEGNTLTCPGFYAPQGREVRLKTSVENLVDRYNKFVSGDFRLTNFEMETAGYYAMGRMLGHEMLSLNAIVANRITHNFSRQADEIVDQLIKKVLQRL